MKKLGLFLVVGFFLSAFAYPQETGNPSAAASGKGNKWVLVIHGGAGGSAKNPLSPETEKQYKEKMSEVLGIGDSILRSGGSSLDAVEAVIRFMEDSPMFNAGKGAVLTEEGRAELDASIMDGRTLKAGAVACVTTIKNPVVAARKVMDNSNHVMFIGSGAEKFARSQGLEIVDPSYFITDEQKDKWLKMKENKHGTVGAVALDMYGNLAAATSTGGMMNKMAGRVGDSPIIGAGTYANNNTCAVSCTGHGEFFIRNEVAYDVSARMEYLGWTLEKATRYIILEKLKSLGADGGLISVDKEGNISMPFNTYLMFRGYSTSAGRKEVMIY